MDDDELNDLRFVVTLIICGSFGGIILGLIIGFLESLL